ncbi:MAG: hypothetical protein OEZ29_05170, partial [Candidatus Bathyarchaeota archaeon]|nr:hypothetical protein [Candidatus Bathyarchaeota archaeon]
MKSYNIIKIMLGILLLSIILVGPVLLAGLGDEVELGRDAVPERNSGRSTTQIEDEIPAAAPLSGSTIVVDGYPSDWAGISPIVSDVKYDASSPGDIHDVYVTDDGTYLYLMMELDSIGGFVSLYLELDVDQNITTGYNTNLDPYGWYMNPHDTGIDFGIWGSLNYPSVSLVLRQIFADGTSVYIKDVAVAAEIVIETCVLLSDIGEPAPPSINMHFQTAYLGLDEAPDIGYVTYAPSLVPSLVPEDLELYPRMLGVWDPMGTQWHELHPENSRYWYLTGWEPGKVLGPTDQIDMGLVDSKIVFEEAHSSYYTIGTNPAANVTGGYSAFANYLTANGYTVSTIDPGTTIDSDVLDSVGVLVIVAPQNSYSIFELDAIETWVQGGGKLLLISEAGIAGQQARTIAARFNIVLKGDVICDSDENVGSPSWPYYDGDNLLPMEITAGVARVEMYDGDGITSFPPNEFPLIMTDFDGTATWLSDNSSAMGISVMSAMGEGLGQLIVIGDSNVWDSAMDCDGDGDTDFYDSDNEILALNSVHWLAYEPFEVDEVTIDLVILDEGNVTHWLDYKCGYWTFDPEKPVSTKWDEIKPDQGRCWHLTNWTDNGDGKLGYCDSVNMTLMYPWGPSEMTCHVEQVTVTLKLTRLGYPEVQLWASKAAMPTARGQAAVIAGDDGLIYVMGGFDSGPEFTTVEAYDPIHDTWTTKTSMPQKTRGAAVAKGLDGTIYVISGVAGPTLLSTLQAYNSTTDTWTSKSPIPTPVWEADAATDFDGKIYVIGGRNSSNTPTNKVQVYDPSNDSWTTKTSMPTARCQLGVVAGYDGLIYAIGGWNGSAAISTVEAYEPYSDTWIAKNPLPTALCQFGATVDPYMGKIYVIGGSTSFWNNDPPFYNTTYSYDAWSEAWMPELDMPTARRELGVTAAHGKLYAIGGGNTYSGGPYGNWTEEATINLEAYLEFNGTLDEFQGMDCIHAPVSTVWHEIWPKQNRMWHLGGWKDLPTLSPSDQIVLTTKDHKRFVVMIGDAPVHLAPAMLPGYPYHGYGGDPGRDEIMSTDDDLDYWLVIEQLASGGITVFTVNYDYGPVNNPDAYTNFDYIANQTGGTHYNGTTAWNVSIANEIATRIGAGHGDVVFTYDLSSSLWDDFEDMKNKTKAIIDALSSLNVGFGVGTHVDYPDYYDSFGYAAQYGDPYSGDYAWSMDTDITDAATAKSVIQSVVGGTYNGADSPQNYARVLYECQHFSWREGTEYHVDKVTVAMNLTSTLD